MLDHACKLGQKNRNLRAEFTRMRIGLLSDTHSHMDDRIIHHLQGVDEIWHAGDIGTLDVTDRLAEIAPLRAVFGNIDDHRIRAEFREELRWETEGLNFLMRHIGGRPDRYASGVRTLLQHERPDVFICGHSHLLRIERDATWGGLYINPGAAGVHGFHRVRTILRFELHNGQINHMEAIELGPRVRNVGV